MKRRLPQLDPPVPRRRILTPQEAALWRSAMEQSAGHHLPPASAEPPSLPPAEHAPAREVPRSALPKPKPTPLAPHAMDGQTRARIRKGRTDIDATLDLHGYTVEAAYQMLVRFVARMQGESARVLLVITGKGRAPQSGILRAQLPHWLELLPLREQISSFSLAGKDHGGEGAWYLRLRKRGGV